MFSSDNLQLLFSQLRWNSKSFPNCIYARSAFDLHFYEGVCNHISDNWKYVPPPVEEFRFHKLDVKLMFALKSEFFEVSLWWFAGLLCVFFVDAIIAKTWNKI